MSAGVVGNRQGTSLPDCPESVLPSGTDDGDIASKTPQIVLRTRPSLSLCLSSPISLPLSLPLPLPPSRLPFLSLSLPLSRDQPRARKDRPPSSAVTAVRFLPSSLPSYRFLLSRSPPFALCGIWKKLCGWGQNNRCDGTRSVNPCAPRPTTAVCAAALHGSPSLSLGLLGSPFSVGCCGYGGEAVS